MPSFINGRAGSGPARGGPPRKVGPRRDGGIVRGGCARAVIAALLAVGSAVPIRAQTLDVREITLEEAIRLALVHDPAAVAAEAAVDIAGANLLQARGAFLPSLSLGSAYSNSSNQRFDQATGQLMSTSYSAQVDASIDLFEGGRRFAQHRAASAALGAAEAERRAQRFQTVLRVTRAYFAAAAAVEIERAAVQRLERARQQLEFARTRLELGTATMSDALRAEIEVGNAEIAALDAASATRTTGLELGRLIGDAVEARPIGAALPASAPPLPSLPELVERAVQRSPAVVAARENRRSRHADRLASYTGYLPSIRATGGYDWFSFQFPPSEQSWSMRVTASIPVFNGFQREASVQRANAAERTATARERDAENAVRVAVESAVLAIDVAERRVEISDRAVELAREDLRVQEERYQLGMATILDLQASQVALTEAEIAAVRARQMLGTAVAELEAVLGERLEGSEGE